MKTFFTSDPHFGHENIIKFCKRPFVNAAGMDQVMINDWNKIVGKKDQVYCLGDFAMHRHQNMDKVLEVIDQLNGQIRLIWGNHDHRTMWQIIALLRPGKVILEGDRVEIKIGTDDIALCHYSHQVWNRSHFGALHLFGHSHNQTPGIGKSMDVGVDAKYQLYGDWAPFTIEQIRERLSTKEIFGKVTD